jgi:hypothetical protein
MVISSFPLQMIEDRLNANPPADQREVVYFEAGGGVTTAVILRIMPSLLLMI